MNENMNKDQAIGMMVGLAVGDALGAYLEFSPMRSKESYITTYQSGGPHDLAKGDYTDDTSMALALADSLIQHHGKLNVLDVARKWIAWMDKGDYSSTGHCFDIGCTTSTALNAIKRRLERMKEFSDESKSLSCFGEQVDAMSGNGAIMRMAPVIIAAKTEQDAVEMSCMQTRITHGSETCARFSTALARELYQGHRIEDYNIMKLNPLTEREEVPNTGYVLHTYQAAWWAVQNTNTFEDAIITAVNLGGDADTIGAVAGQIAGRIYGYSAIPKHFIEHLTDANMITTYASELYTIANTIDNK
jgi:ADP-ribosyl-[dinitrogen reductase] hydrolase